MTDAGLRALSDEELGARLAEPEVERAAYAEAYRRFYPPMLRAAAQLLGGEMALAEDVVQECFAAVFLGGRLERLRDPTHLRAYLLASVRNAALNALTRGKRHEPLTPEIEAATAEPPELWKVHPGLKPVLDRLSPPEREILDLRFQQGLRLDEIAGRLKISYSAAAQRLSRAVHRARQLALTA